MAARRTRPKALNGNDRCAAGCFPASFPSNGPTILGRAVCRRAFRRTLGFICADVPLVDTGPVPERLRNAEGIDADGLPPGLFVANAVHLAVVRSAERHRELIARLAPQ